MLRDRHVMCLSEEQWWAAFTATIIDRTGITFQFDDGLRHLILAKLYDGTLLTPDEAVSDAIRHCRFNDIEASLHGSGSPNAIPASYGPVDCPL